MLSFQHYHTSLDTVCFIYLCPFPVNICLPPRIELVSENDETCSSEPCRYRYSVRSVFRYAYLTGRKAGRPDLPEVITWAEAVRIDWGIILLFGGGLSLGGLAFSTGLAESLGHGILAWMPGRTPLAFTMIFTALAILMTEVASNTASATMMLPSAIAVSTAAGVRPLEPALGATIGASMDFMLPISTPPNAIVYSSGCVPITAMIRHGVVLDLFAFAAIVTFVLLFGSIVVG